MRTAVLPLPHGPNRFRGQQPATLEQTEYASPRPHLRLSDPGLGDRRFVKSHGFPVRAKDPVDLRNSGNEGWYSAPSQSDAQT